MESMIKNLYATESFCGCSDEEIAFMKEKFGALPAVLEKFYKNVAKTEALHHGQDTWMLPEHFAKYTWLNNSECLILINENQGVCKAGIRRADLTQPDPPVYVKTDDNEWLLSAPTTSEFLKAMLGYQSVFDMVFSYDEYYWITEEELETIQAKMEKLPYEVHNWMYGMEISLYSNAPDNIVTVTDCDGDLQVWYGANSEEGYAALMTVMEGLGEEM